MKYAGTLLAVVVVGCLMLAASAAHPPDSDPPECAVPLPIGTPVTVYHEQAQYQNHLVYWPCDDCTTNPVSITPNQLAYEVNALAFYWQTQDFLWALPKNQPGDDYCLHFSELGDYSPPVYLLWPVPMPEGGCGGLPTTTMTAAQFAWVEQGSNEFDCVLDFLRAKGI